VAIDTLTGESLVLKVDILHDVGQSINPALDIGQIEGGFVKGMGWLTTEQLVWKADGTLATHAPAPTRFRPPATFPSTYASTSDTPHKRITAPTLPVWGEQYGMTHFANSRLFEGYYRVKAGVVQRRGVSAT
jgi:hypothetical protein